MSLHWDFTVDIPDLSYMSLMFSLMTLGSDSIVVDHKENSLVFDDGLVLQLSDLFNSKNKDNEPNAERTFTYTFDFFVKKMFDDPLGKYP